MELKAEKQSAHSDYVFSVAFSPDGKTIVSGSDDKTLKVWGTLAFLTISRDLAPHHALSFGRCLVPGAQGREAECTHIRALWLDLICAVLS